MKSHRTVFVCRFHLLECRRENALMSPLGNAMQIQCSKTLVRIYRIYRRFFGNCDLLQTIKTRYKRIALCFVRE